MQEMFLGDFHLLIPMLIMQVLKTCVKVWTVSLKNMFLVCFKTYADSSVLINIDDNFLIIIPGDSTILGQKCDFFNIQLFIATLRKVCKNYFCLWLRA